MNVIRFIILLLIFFVCFLIMAKHAEENEMVDEHQAIADLDKKLQMKDLQAAVKEFQDQKELADPESEPDAAEYFGAGYDPNDDENNLK